MAENKFAKSIHSQKTKTELEESQVTAGEATVTETVPPEDEIANPDKIKELFPGNAKAKTSNAHSLYLNDVTWTKLQKIAKKEKISVSAVVQRILDSML